MIDYGRGITFLQLCKDHLALAQSRMKQFVDKHNTYRANIISTYTLVLSNMVLIKCWSKSEQWRIA
ncbi:hypothetical protein V2J09_021752 [Rumex salicifolius]